MSENDSIIEIRPAARSDAARISLLLHDAFVEYRSLYTPDAFAATTPAEEQIIRRMDEGPVWIAVRNDTIVGTVAAVDRGEDLYIRGMAVLPAARGAAIGERLLKSVERFAGAEGYRRLLLSTTPYLDRAIRLYERYGFRRIDEGPGDLFGTPLFSMAKIVGASERI